MQLARPSVALRVKFRFKADVLICNPATPISHPNRYNTAALGMSPRHEPPALLFRNVANSDQLFHAEDLPCDRWPERMEDGLTIPA